MTDAFYSADFYRPFGWRERATFGMTAGRAHAFEDGPAGFVIEQIFERTARFLHLSPVEAARAWTGYEFGVGSMYGIDEETALCFAVCQDPEITLHPAEAFEVVLDLLEDEDFDTDDDAERDRDAEYLLDVLRRVSAHRTRRR